MIGADAESEIKSLRRDLRRQMDEAETRREL